MRWFGRKRKPPAGRSPARKRRWSLVKKRISRWLEPVRTALRWASVLIKVGWPVAATVALAWAAIVAGSSSPIFTAAEVEVRGLRYLERDGLLLRAGLEPAPNLLAMSLNDVAARLLAEPWVERLKLERHLPNRLVVEVVEREVVAVVRTPGRAGPTDVLVDGEGVVLRAAEAGDRLRLPVVVGARGPAPRPGVRFTDPRVVSGLAVLQATEGVPLMGRRSLAMIDCTYADRIILKGRRSEAVVAVRGGHLERKFARLKTVAAELKRRHGSIRYIDLSFDRRVIVKDADREG
jgi:cell division protein FtsQ